MRVLIVEDDPAMRDLLERGLREELFLVESVADAAAAEQRALPGAFDAILLDVILPDNDGFMACRRLRARGVDTPILLLTGRSGVYDRVQGLDSGADDYLAKPFAFPELLARLRALTRRGRSKHLDAKLSCGPVELDQHARAVRIRGELVAMTATEFRLLEYLLLRAETVVTRADLVHHVWGGQIGRDSNAIDVYISNLRRRLKPAGVPLLRTIRRFGYMLSAGPQS